jgi:antitoxin (DNA-binding transcriptional repressor) of toxin-antitoxin stability system
MNKVVNIYEAKTNFSKLVKKAASGETIYVGAYGQAQVIIAPAPKKKPIQIGIWAHKKKPGYNYDNDDLVKPDKDVIQSFNKSIDSPLP